LKKKSIIVISVILFVLLIDQLVKIWVKTDLLSGILPGGNFQITEARPLIPNFVQLYFIENRGMAFGTTLGDGVWAKYILSVFRFAAIIGIAIYLRKLIKEGEVGITFLVTIALIFSGAAGNLIDGVCYDLVFGIDPSIRENWVVNEFGFQTYDETGNVILRKGGFLLGSVVDMFQFTLKWPESMPFGLGGQDVFPFIFNVADMAISLGVAMIIFRYKRFFKKEEQTDTPEIKSE